MEKKITDFTDIKTFEDALQATGRPEVPAFADVPEDMRNYHRALYKGSVIAEAINGSWKPDWANTKQCKWFPWFRVDGVAPSGFAFDDAFYDYSTAYAGHASRLCFESEAKAAHAGCTFVEVYAAIITK